ncbi:MAG: bifunctional DNA-formamidopyrimidine glycosylase/DNA-(apurinic or apyrimidinic site) lyase [Oligosphaeraceae bacterium]|nr:bifunctional DNA-formamidopyrimidine glycosylase/DNA-(apurinic or apyrimidinic site) lyase [Oligosphaeraceae bacterium]
MPELPEVHTVCQSLRQHLHGVIIVSAMQHGKLRHYVESTELDAFCKQQRIIAIRRRAKYILVEFERGGGLILHLGMTGRFIVEPDNGHLLPHERSSWLLDDGRRWRYCDARRFGAIYTCAPELPFEQHPALMNLGIEPLSEEFTGTDLHALCRGRKTPIKNLLMSQQYVVGIGNIYACEALFASGISPLTAAGTLSLPRCKSLVTAIKTVLQEAIALGGSTIRDYQSVNGSEGEFQLRLQVYGKDKQSCPRCNSRITRCTQAGRSSYYCPKCQKM